LEGLTKKAGVKAFVISDITDSKDRKFIEEVSEQQFWVPRSGYLSALLCIIPI